MSDEVAGIPRPSCALPLLRRVVGWRWAIWEGRTRGDVWGESGSYLMDCGWWLLHGSPCPLQGKPKEDPVSSSLTDL